MALVVDPTIITDVDARFSDDGDLITSAGLSAGIDMALHLVARGNRCPVGHPSVLGLSRCAL